MHLRIKGKSTGANLLSDIADIQKLISESESEMETCPECEGSNLNEDHTKCWDCSASDMDERTR